ncbi:MAG: transporter substrate-binding domain-containing protein [Clostridia bacterium]
MKKIIVMVLVIALALSAFAGCAPKEQETLYMYTETGFPPFEYKDGTKTVGVDVDIANYIAKELNMKLEIKDVAFATICGAVAEHDNAIGLAGLTIDDERKLTVDFTTPYWEANLGIIYKKGALKPDANNVIQKSTLSGKKVGVQTGTSGDTAVQEISGAIAKQYDNALIAAQAIGTGCDYVVIDNIVAANIVANATKLGLEWANLDSDAEYFALAVKKGNTELMKKVNPIIEKLIKDGKIEEFIANHKVG